jgi:tellurite resistance protein TehA-like permease
MTSANLLIVLIVGTVVGALTGLGLGSFFGNQLYLAILAGFLGTIIGGMARNFIMARGSGAGPNDSRTPTLVIVYSAIASLAGSSAAMEVAQQSEVSASVWIGTLAGLFSAILMALLMITYHTNPGEAPKLHPARR